MPRRREAWASWNCIRRAQETANAQNPVCVTYWLNRLQNPAQDAPNLFVTLNPVVPVKEAAVVRRMVMDHPVLTKDSVAAQQRLPSIQGTRRTWYCGAYTRFGFHEDGFISGLAVATRITGNDVPWRHSPMFNHMVAVHDAEKDRELSSWKFSWSSLRDVAMSPIASVLRTTVEAFTARSVKLGSLTLIDPKGERKTFGQSPAEARCDSRPVATVQIKSPRFYSRVAYGGELGFAEAFIHGDLETETPDALSEVFKVFIENRDTGSMKIDGMRSASVRMAIGKAVHRFLNRNDLSGSKKNIEAHYDLSNDLFATFLGKAWTYSCGIWDRPGMTLDEAQWSKLDKIIDNARIQSHHHVLEIGFGWGECAIRMVQRTGCRVTGLTLSKEQLALAEQRAEEAGVGGHINFLLCDYRTMTGKFDRIVSIEMIEAVGHEFLGPYFAALDRLLTDDGLAVVQVITTPEERYEHYRTSTDFINTYIFPGGCAPSNHALLDAMSKNSRLILESQENFGPHYATTLAEWRRRFLASRKRIDELGFPEEFVRTWVYYFCYCESGFATRSLGLLQMVFSRINNVGVLGGQPPLPPT
eukprot:Plantae.Rhodophyta-Rhodochaete_pulchella.ctg62775.p1 GENE.Plantae.Rhodophyta-Rhodochaete_pulchella.ctg62775~~Plantae.Rhodophyta-Rhodochaete_pulchella.ctg62775.p1  ORF type:complete len:611 (+),score=78.20 Plantae.Rhodophyta-Rhodochaete_pulchella.ctg62775:81-1835(+)